MCQNCYNKIDNCPICKTSINSQLKEYEIVNDEIHSLINKYFN